VADYKSAYEREKTVRKEAEQLLEDRSRELYRTNDQLTDQFQKMSLEFQKNTLLLEIFHYSLDSLKLSESLPNIINSMLSMANLSGGFFDYFPLDRSRDYFRSELFINKTVSKPHALHEMFEDSAIGEAIGSVSVEVLLNRRMFYLTNFKKNFGINMEASFGRFGVGGILAFPVVANNYTSAIIYMFLDCEEENIEELVSLFESSVKQLGILIEHRYSSEKLEENYYQLKNMVDELGVAQKQLLHAEKMASIGQLSAGIAHEINNPMGYVKSNIGSLKDYNCVFSEGLLKAKVIAELSAAERIKSDEIYDEFKRFWATSDVDYLLEDSHNLMSETTGGIDRVLDIVSGLRSFARASDTKWALCQVNDCLTEALKLSHNELKYKCEIKQSLADIPPIQGNAGELVQVFLNLLINAGQAIVDKGEISVSTNIVNGGIEVRLLDDGCGIADSTLSRIFDPFYTTKEVGKGTGLGLSISFGIIENHSGRIDVTSEEGKGSCFSVWLPVAEQ